MSIVFQPLIQKTRSIKCFGPIKSYLLSTSIIGTVELFSCKQRICKLRYFAPAFLVIIPFLKYHACCKISIYCMVVYTLQWMCQKVGNVQASYTIKQYFFPKIFNIIQRILQIQVNVVIRLNNKIASFFQQRTEYIL